MEESKTPASPGKGKPYNLHAIQLVELRVSDLAIHVDSSVPKEEVRQSFTLETARSAYNPETKQIQVKVTVKVGDDDEVKPPFRLEVTLHGVFKVDESRFDPQLVEDWAERNAPLVLYPYARENVYALTSRAGLPEALLPLLEIPTFRINATPSNA